MSQSANPLLQPRAMRGAGFARIGLALSVAAGVLLFAQHVNQKKHYNLIGERIKQAPTKITSYLKQAYPWESDVKAWEGRRVEFEGYYKDERFMVAREKDGNPGYLVFAPFVTRGAYRPGSNRKTEVSIIVCLGWVPRNHKDRIISDRDKFTEEEVEQQEGEEGEESLIKVSGILRPTETRDILKGAVNWESSQYYKFIDLFLMARFFRIYNLESASKVYLQRVVETEAKVDSMPISYTLDEVIKLHENDRPIATDNLKPAVWSALGSLGLGLLL